MAKPWEKYQKAEATESGPWTKYSEEAPKKSEGTAAQTFGEQAANMLTFGYMPQLTGAIGSGLIKSGLAEDPYSKIVMAKGSKEEIAPLDYTSLRDKTTEEMNARLSEHPVAGGAGMLGGAVLGGAGMGLAARGIGGALGLGSKGIQAAEAAKAAEGAEKASLLARGAGLLGRTGKAASTGAAMAGLQNPGDTEGELSGLQIPERLENMKTGALFGAGGQLAGEGIARGGKAIKDASQGLLNYGKEKAVKATGAMLKDFRQMLGKGQVDDIANEMYNKKLIRPGANFESIAEESTALKQAAGKKIGDIYEKVGGITKMSLDKNKTYNTLVDAVSDSKIRPRVNVDAYDNQMSKVIDDIVGKNDLSDVRNVNEVIGDIDDLINHSKRANELPSIQQGYLKIRQGLRDLVNKHVDEVAESLGNKNIGKELREANKEYQNLSTISKISKDRVARESANRFMSPTDYGSAGLGAGVGGLLGGIKGAAIGSAAGLANKGLRLYANPALAKGAMSLGGALESSPAVQSSIGLLQQANQYPGILGAQTGLLGGPKKDKKNGK